MCKRILLSAITIVCGLTAAIAQTPARVIKGGDLCEDYLLKRAAKERAAGTQVLKLKAFNSKSESLPPKLKEWLGFMFEERLAAYEIRHREKRALVLRSFDKASTGLSTSFQSWYVQSDGRSFDFVSMSEDPKLIFWDKKGLLNYHVIEFGDEFTVNHRGNVTLNLLRYRISPHGESGLVSEERNVRCK